MDLLLIVKLNYGYNTKQAKQYIKTLSQKQKDFLIEGYKQQCKQAFYND